MLRIALVALVMCALAVQGEAQKKPLPQFKDYPVSEKFSGKPARPKLSSANARMFRTQLRRQSGDGPNFAGHYAIALWGCGSGCVEMAIIDLKTGDVFFPPQVERVGVNSDREEEPLDYRTNSRLLIVTGWREASGRDGVEGKFFYEWKDNRLRLIRKAKLETKQD